ncbi:hypothetical protein [uncultured Tateyamaria sp.]|uniref:hypothetical protein n=1 Tax=Tateyamaria sp. 1078 TaxID=3417464 RepID=UPI00260EE196|nr:hypothetical protein [uncultured Tateyamaria sp.]
MSGQYSATGTLKSEHMSVFEDNGFTLNILLDLSHNTTIETESKGRKGQAVIAKAIELDCQMDKGATPDYAQFVTDCSAEGASSPLRSFIDLIKGEARGAGITPQAHLQALLTRSKIKIEFPEFDDSIAALDSLYEGTTVGNAVACARAGSKAAFDGLSSYVRTCMGMYQRTTSTSFTRQPSADQTERKAYPATWD